MSASRRHHAAGGSRTNRRIRCPFFIMSHSRSACRGFALDSACGAARAGAIGQHQFLRHQRRHRQWRQSRRPRRRRQSLPDAGAGGGCRRQDLARLSLHPGRRRQAGGERARPHRQGPVAEFQGRRGRQGRRRAARRQQPHQADRAEREGRGHQRPRRYAEPPRHADRIAAGRHRLRRPATTAPARTGRAARKARRWSGISDRIGLRDDDASKSWNSSHPSRGPDGGCSQADLKSTGGDGLLYCFAAN